MSDWIPAVETEFDAFFKNYCQVVNKYTTGQSPVWTHIPADAITELNGAYAAWYNAWSKLKTPHTSADVLAKDEALAAGKGVLRDFNNEFILYSRFVTDAQRKEIGSPVHDTTHTPVPAPKDQPEADITYPGRHLIELDHIRSVTGGTDDPRADWGVRIHYGILDPANMGARHRIASPPATGEDLPHSVFTHKKKYRFDFDGDSGKTVYFCLKYENEKGGEKGEGPFGPIMQAIIP
ncbi:MAG: hypothetical protein LBI86_04535 [Treponema sp.]|jgi:hypothetical protein|nr:hypothetical protein [Treponema sp.]